MNDTLTVRLGENLAHALQTEARAIRLKPVARQMNREEAIFLITNAVGATFSA